MSKKGSVLRSKLCPYCDCGTRQTTGKEIYPHRPDLHSKRFTTCRKYPLCDAYVGHHDSGAPLGRLARKELRSLKSHVHAAFDPLWKRGRHQRFSSRTAAYQWLSETLNVPVRWCHVGMFDEDQCRDAIAAIKNLRAAA